MKRERERERENEERKRYIMLIKKSLRLPFN